MHTEMPQRNRAYYKVLRNVEYMSYFYVFRTKPMDIFKVLQVSSKIRLATGEMVSKDS